MAVLLAAGTASAQTPLPAGQTTNGDFTVGNSGSVDGKLTVAGDAEIAGPKAPGAYFNGAGSLYVRGDLVFTGSNPWVLHSPNENNRTSLYLAPGYPTTDWGNQTRFDATGDVMFSQKVSIGNVSCTTPSQCTGTLGINNLVLAVGGKIGARGGIHVVNYGAAWPDYVFRRGYHLRPLAELSRFIQLYHHLPDVPSAAEVQANGIELAEMNAALLRKVEELTLYLLRMQAANQALTERVAKLESRK